ncbi:MULTISPECIES: MarR family winged helix-turn-helix transcriptional regulator [unclassified Nocardioides]|uniref:MarR family winged helix-turn-helix transcriptional regulator n=1 Tax=unclassified Nocardioides TaxID=2615069 RepID=UPI0000571B27|nr:MULTISPECIES: MarR family winged helix-turn-helix transcriptional regulator [unclassified Nocardioides]ABL82875.1 transcriptional regulator, MarR family [Nocardioides sp. JS614]
MSDWLTEDEQHTWRSVLRMHTQLTAALAQALKADSELSISDYEVLAILSEAPDGVLRARELRCELRWEKSRLAHHIGRMEQRGYVRRDACADDQRAPLMCLTETGRAAIRAAAPTHVARVRELFFSALTPAQARAMREAADAVLDNLGSHASVDARDES